MNALTNWLAHELPKYWKAAIATVPVVVFVGTEAVQALSNGAADGTLTAGDLFACALAGITAFTVYAKGNAPADD